MLEGLQAKQAQHYSFADENRAGDHSTLEYICTPYKVLSRAGFRIREAGEGSMYAGDNAAQALNVAVELMRE